MKTAVIIKGNPQYIRGNRKAVQFYLEIRRFLKSLGYSVTVDPGKPYTSPPAANLWIGHSRGADRLQYAPKGTLTLAFGSPRFGNERFTIVNHPKDEIRLRRWVKERNEEPPGDEHYIFTPEIKKAILKLDRKISQTKLAAIV